MRYTIRYVLLGLILLLSACVTMRDLPIETLQPARLEFAGSKQRIAICASPVLLSDAILSNQGTSGVAADSLIMNILYSLENFWEQAPGFENTSFSVFLSDSIHPSFDMSKFDLTVRLNSLQLKNVYYGEQYTYQSLEAWMHVLYLADWSVRNKSNQPVDHRTDRDMVVWSSGVCRTEAEVIANLPNLYDAWWDTGITVARNYAELVSPQWKTEVRYIYMINKFPDLSTLAYNALQNNGYARAINIWEEMVMSCRKKGQKKAKSQIAYNIAVAYEYDNLLDEAIEWVEKSIAYTSNTENNRYLYHLKERQQQSKLLDQQIYQ